ncbi:MAG: hypothetical protein ACJATP_001534 [Candidatus Azotimanducaceae bacterium]
MVFVQDGQFNTKAVIGLDRDGFADSVKMQLVKFAHTIVKADGKPSIAG